MSIPRVIGAGQEISNFDAVEHLDRLLAEVGLSSQDAGGSVTFEGADPIFASPHRLGASIGLPIMGCAIGAAAIWKMRTGQGQDLHLDLRKAIHGINPEFTWHPTINGDEYSHATAGDNPFLLDPFQTRDGRWVMASGVYPHMVAAWLRFLDCPNSEEAVRAAIAGRDAQELEDSAAAAGLPLAICRTPQGWEAHPQGALLAASPVISIRKIADGPPQPFSPGKRPLQDVRVLAFVHAIAGSVVGRTLAEQGADVLCATFPNHFEHDFIYADANVGSRSANLNLNHAAGLARARELLRDTDIVVDNHRGAKLWEFGLAPDQLAEYRPGIISVSIRAYGTEGPWADRGGFDMNGSAASGLMAIEGGPGAPRLPPTSMINDYITGYMGALGATAALIRRATEGGSYHVTVNLTRNAMWYRSLGLVDPAQAGSSELNRALEPDTVTSETPFGTLNRLAPPVQFSRTPGSWQHPMLVVRGSSRPEWVAPARAQSWISRLLGRPLSAQSLVETPAAVGASEDSLRALCALTERRIGSASLDDLDVRYQFEAGGAGDFALVIGAGIAEVRVGRIADPSVTLSTSADTLTEILSGDLSPVKAYFTGKLKLKGDKMAAKRLASLIDP